jgi:hypothetical protein
MKEAIRKREKRISSHRYSSHLLPPLSSVTTLLALFLLYFSARRIRRKGSNTSKKISSRQQHTHSHKERRKETLRIHARSFVSISDCHRLRFVTVPHHHHHVLCCGCVYRYPDNWYFIIKWKGMNIITSMKEIGSSGRILLYTRSKYLIAWLKKNKKQKWILRIPAASFIYFLFDTVSIDLYWVFPTAAWASWVKYKTAFRARGAIRVRSSGAFRYRT